MIILTRLNGEEFYLNPDLIEVIEETPDTVVSLSNGKKYVVSEKSSAIVDKIIQYRQKIYHNIDSIIK